MSRKSNKAKRREQRRMRAAQNAVNTGTGKISVAANAPVGYQAPDSAPEELDQTSQAIAESIEQQRRVRFNPLAHLTAPRLVQALDNWECGDLRDAAILWDTISKRDDTIPTVKSKREKAAALRSWDVLPVDDDERKSFLDNQEIPEDTQAHRDCLRDFWNNIRAVDAWDRNRRGGLSMLIRMMQEAVSFRYAAFNIVWKPTKIACRDGSGHRYCLRAELEKVPLWYFENRTGKLRFVKDGMGYDGVDLEPGRWLISTGDGLMIAASVGYYAKRLTFQDWLIFSEKFSMPGVVGRTNAKKGTVEGDSVRDAVAAFGNDFACVLYGDDGTSKIELIQANGNPSAMPMPALIDRVDRKITALYRGADLSTMSSGSEAEGTGASVQSDESNILDDDDAVTRAEELRELERIVIAWTFGKDVEPLAQIVIGGESQTDEVEDAEAEAGEPETTGMGANQARLSKMATEFSRKMAGNAAPEKGTAFLTAAAELIAQARREDQRELTEALRAVVLIDDPEAAAIELERLSAKLPDYFLRSDSADPGEVVAAWERVLAASIAEGWLSTEDENENK